MCRRSLPWTSDSSRTREASPDRMEPQEDPAPGQKEEEKPPDSRDSTEETPAGAETAREPDADVNSDLLLLDLLRYLPTSPVTTPPSPLPFSPPHLPCHYPTPHSPSLLRTSSDLSLPLPVSLLPFSLPPTPPSTIPCPVPNPSCLGPGPVGPSRLGALDPPNAGTDRSWTGRTVWKRWYPSQTYSSTGPNP